MPEIKNAFLSGKMNKSLDDRLVPNGEYLDALNIQVSKSEGQNVGSAHNILGNLSVKDLGLDVDAKVVGAIPDNKRNAIYVFVSATTDGIYEIKPNESPVVVNTLCENNFLNFDPNKYITGINILEDYLYWTDDINEPRKIYIGEDAVEPTDVTEISVAKLAPHKAPLVALSYDIYTYGDYMEERFLRFAYRFKYEDNTYSVISPFSNIAFAISLDQPSYEADAERQAYVLTEDEVQRLYASGEADFAVNKANKAVITIYSCTEDKTFSEEKITQIEVLAKSSDSSAVYVMDIISPPSPTSTSTTYTYNSSPPKFTLPERELIRVYDDVPVAAKSQEIVGNRLIYGNFLQNKNFTDSGKIAFGIKSGLNFGSIQEGDYAYKNYLSLKADRIYQVGLVFSDIYGRTTPVMLSSGISEIEGEGNDMDETFYDGTIKIVGESLEQRLYVLFNDTSISGLNELISNGYVYYSVVIKQSQQEYYNVYTPGFGKINGKTYFSLFGDNINKIPLDTNTFNQETSLNATSTKTKLSVINTSSFTKSVQEDSQITEEVLEYEVSASYSNLLMSNYVPSDNAYNETTESWTFNGTTASFSINFDHNDAALNDISAYHTSVRVYLNGERLISVPTTKDGVVVPAAFSYNSSTETVTFNGDFIPESGNSVFIFPEYDNIPIPSGSSRTIYSFKQPKGTNLRIEETGETQNVVISGYGSVFSNSENITSQEQGNLVSVKITGIGTRDLFEISEQITSVSEGKFGLYKKDSNYLLAEIDGSYGVPLYDDPSGQLADLAILETAPFESSLDIFYETSTQGKIQDIVDAIESSEDPQGDTFYFINYFNSFLLKTPTRNNIQGARWQESRIKGAFNAPSMDFGVQAYLVDENFKQQRRESSLIYSGIYNSRTGVNNINQFPSGENITKSLDPTSGSIQKLFAEDNDLIVFQEEKVSQIPVDRDIIYSAEGSATLISSNNVLGDIISYAGNYGIANNPESFAYYAGRKYFVDSNKNVILRLSRDGMTEISNYGLRSYFRDLLENYSGKVLGCYDVYNHEYVINANSVTIGFDESVTGWTSRYSYQPDMMISLQNKFYSFKGDNLYEHYHSEANYSTFYGTSYDSSIELILNANPSLNKSFHTLNYEGSSGWRVTSITTDSDQGLQIDSYANNTVDTEEYFYVSKFQKQNGKYASMILNNTSSGENEILFGEEISGIKGFFAKLTIKTSDTQYRELFAVSTNFNINNY